MKVAIIILCLVAIGCSHRVMTPAEGRTLVHSEQAAHGREIFMEYCNKCHPGGMAGLGPAIINKPLPGALIRFQVRNGLGVMPAFDKEHISSGDLDDLVAYLKEL